MAEEKGLPRSEDWRYRPYDFPTFKLAAGERRKIIDLRRHGWVVWGAVLLDNPDVRCAIELETGTETYREVFTVNDLMEGGMIQAQPTAWWVSRYNNLIPLYCVSFTPAQWWPFYRRFMLELENPTAQEVTVHRIAVLCIEFIEVLP
jgi:hypothetical protein